MPSLRISEHQAAELSDDMVRRHAVALGRRTDARAAGNETVPAGLPPDAPRLKALHLVLRGDLQQQSGEAAPYLAVDLEHCARQLLRALQAGAVYRETAAAALMSAAAGLGASWLGDERLCVDGHQAVPALPDPVEPAALREWAEASWADRHRFASQRSRALLLAVRYAIARVNERDGFDAQGLRSLADVIFEAAEEDRLRRFLASERGLLMAAGLDARTHGDRRVESLCLAGDLAFGLGRFVRLALAARAAGPGTSDDALLPHLRKAFDVLAN